VCSRAFWEAVAQNQELSPLMQTRNLAHCPPETSHQEKRLFLNCHSWGLEGHDEKATPPPSASSWRCGWPGSTMIAFSHVAVADGCRLLGHCLRLEALTDLAKVSIEVRGIEVESLYSPWPFLRR
jgi:hypothetical protein